MPNQSTTAEVILAAGRDPFTLAALAILVLAVIAKAWLSTAPVHVRERAFYVMLIVAVGFGGAGIARVWPSPGAIALDSPSAASATQESACPGGMPRFADGSRECLPVTGALFISPEMKIRLRDRCRALAAQGISHDGYTSTSRCFDHGAG